MNSKISQKRYSLVRNSIIGVLVLFCSTLGLIYYYSRIPEIQVEGYVTYKDSNKDVTFDDMMNNGVVPLDILLDL